MKRSLIIVAGLAVSAGVPAVTVSHGSATVHMDFVNINFAGNTPDTSGYGTVDYNYRIGRYEVTIEQFMAARAADTRISNGDEDVWNNGSLSIVGAGAPASSLKWYEAAKFCNWLTSGDAFKGAYQFEYYDLLMGVDRDAAIEEYGTVYVLPTEDEWYKAAYFKPDASGYSLYANGSDNVADLTRGTTDGWNYANDQFQTVYTPPRVWETGFGAEEQNGTYDMMGNIEEMLESPFDGVLNNLWEQRVVRGGGAFTSETSLRSSSRVAIGPSNQYSTGFRVAMIPEPSGIALIGLVSGCAVVVRRRFTV